MTDEERDAKYPVHAKVRAHKAEADIIGRFLETMREEHNAVLATPAPEDSLGRPLTERWEFLDGQIERQLAVYFGIDLKALSDEKDAMYKELVAGLGRTPR